MWSMFFLYFKPLDQTSPIIYKSVRDGQKSVKIVEGVSRKKQSLQTTEVKNLTAIYVEQ